MNFKDKQSKKELLKHYKRQAAALVGYPFPTRIHQSKKKYSRNREKKKFKDELDMFYSEETY